MNAAMELVRLTAAFNARLWMENDRLELDVPADFPTGLVQLLREHKAEVLDYLSQHPQPSGQRWRIKFSESQYSDDAEIEDIRQSIHQRGVVLVWSTALDDLVAFHRPEFDLHDIPPGFVPYSTRELAVLFGQHGVPSHENLKLIHEAKKYGVRIIDDAEGKSS